jgi:hypothetical protein
MKYTIALTRHPDGRQDTLRVIGQGIDFVFMGEFVTVDYRPRKDMQSDLTTSINVIQSIRGEQNEES